MLNTSRSITQRVSVEQSVLDACVVRMSFSFTLWKVLHLCKNHFRCMLKQKVFQSLDILKSVLMLKHPLVMEKISNKLNNRRNVSSSGLEHYHGRKFVENHDISPIS